MLKRKAPERLARPEGAASSQYEMLLGKYQGKEQELFYRVCLVYALPTSRLYHITESWALAEEEKMAVVIQEVVREVEVVKEVRPPSRSPLCLSPSLPSFSFLSPFS